MDSRLLGDVDTGRRALWRDSTSTERMLLHHVGYPGVTAALRTLVVRDSAVVIRMRWPALELAEAEQQLAAARHVLAEASPETRGQAAADVARWQTVADDVRRVLDSDRR